MRGVLTVLSNPRPGYEEAYNDWYQRIHLPDVLRVPGFIRAQRFRLAGGAAAAGFRYLAIYEFDSEQPEALLGELQARAGGADMVLSEAMDLEHYQTNTWVALTAQPTLAEGARGREAA